MSDSDNKLFSTIIIPAHHAYFEMVSSDVYQVSNSKWHVTWRDFYAFKQDKEFDTEAEARAFAAQLLEPPLVEKVYDGDDPGALSAADQLWQELAAEHRLSVARKIKWRWRRAFGGARPLKIGIFEDLKAALPDVHPNTVAAILSVWVKMPAYLAACTTGA